MAEERRDCAPESGDGLSVLHSHLSDDKAVAKIGHGPSHPQYVAMRVDENGAPRRVLLSFDEDSQTSYAAIPVRNGWLIFQL